MYVPPRVPRPRLWHWHARPQCDGGWRGAVYGVREHDAEKSRGEEGVGGFYEEKDDGSN